MHVDFTAIAEAGTEAGLDFLGYTNQATFLLNCGLTDVVARTRRPMRHVTCRSPTPGTIS